MSDGKKRLAAYLNKLAKEASDIQSRLYRLEHCIREIVEKLDEPEQRKVNES